MRGSDYIAAFLAAQGVERVYEMTGGMIAHIIDAVGARDDLATVSMHHEQAAAFAAEADARMTGVPGVALATSGPGATNLVTGIGSCFFDSVPAVFITGQVNTNEQCGDSAVRQSGFQETDIVAVVEPITKAAWRVTDVAELPAVLEDAFRTALSGRQGPVLVDVPMNVQRADFSPGPIALVRPDAPQRPARELVESVHEALSAAQRPLVLAGAGVRSSGAQSLLREFAHAWGLPVVTSLPGIDSISSSDASFVGMIGTYGNRWANEALGRTDVLLVIGSRLDGRQTGADTARFVADKTVIRVDVDPHELAWRVESQIAVEADAREFLASLLETPAPPCAWEAWNAELRERRDAAPEPAELADISGINVASFMHELSGVASDVAAFVVDVGQNQMWAAQSLRLNSGQRFLTSAGMGAMGFSLPAAIGASLAAPGRPVVSIAGDGGSQVNIQELETAARLGLPLRIIVLDNGCLGMVRQFQDENLGSRHRSTVWGYGAPDFVRVAEAYGIPGRSITTEHEVPDAVRWLIAESSGPALLHVVLPNTTKVRPKVAFGDPVFVMAPPPSTTEVE